MNNDEAMAILTEKRTAINAAINGLNLYVQQKDNWLAAIRTSHMTQARPTPPPPGGHRCLGPGRPLLHHEEED